MRTSVLISIVVGLHCAAIGSLLFIQGCGTTPKQQPAPTQTMPPIKSPDEMPPPAVTGPGVPPPVVEAAKPAAAGTAEYVVKSGDSLGKIAKEFGVSKAEIAQLNNLSDPNKLRIGQKIVIPAGGKTVVAKATAAPKHAKPAAPKAEKPAAIAEAAAAAGPGEYIVQSGDSLSKIAAKHGVKMSALREANKLQSDKLKIGQKLVIPQAKPAGEAAPEVKAPEAASPDAAVPVDKPAVATDASAAPVAATPAVGAGANLAPSSSGLYHIVQPGEDLDSIAKLYVVTANEIADLNHIPAKQPLQVGQRLKIP